MFVPDRMKERFEIAAAAGAENCNAGFMGIHLVMDLFPDFIITSIHFQVFLFFGAFSQGRALDYSVSFLVFHIFGGIIRTSSVSFIFLLWWTLSIPAILPDRTSTERRRSGNV